MNDSKRKKGKNPQGYENIHNDNEKEYDQMW
jgi:hypothetical protein